MVFYVYFEPAVFRAAQDGAPLALQLLIASLRGFLQNCILVDFEDYRLQNAIGEEVAAMPPSFDRKLIKSLMSTFSKRNRFTYCLLPDYTSVKSDQEIMLQQAATALIDLALLAADPAPDLVVPNQMEVTTLLTYQHSHFEPTRSKLASSGKRSKPGEMRSSDFMTFHFHKTLKFATKIELCDRAFGKYFGDNYKYTLRQFLNWLEKVLVKPEACELNIHCELPAGKKGRDIESELKAGKRGRLGSMIIRVHYYDGFGLADSLPHERFIRTEQFALSIDRGLDFLDKSSQANRDVFITSTDPLECESVLQCYCHKRSGAPRVL